MMSFHEVKTKVLAEVSYWHLSVTSMFTDALLQYSKSIQRVYVMYVFLHMEKMGLFVLGCLFTQFDMRLIILYVPNITLFNTHTYGNTLQRYQISSRLCVCKHIYELVSYVLYTYSQFTMKRTASLLKVYENKLIMINVHGKHC